MILKKFGRLPQLLLLALTVLTYNVVAIAIANSLFVSKVGAGHLPIAFILIGLCSLPLYAIFAQIADRYSRPQIFRYVLVTAMILMVGLRLLINYDAAWVYYVLLIVIFFQWDFNNNLLYPGLLTDYFTTIEYKQYAPYIGMAQAAGTLMGGGLTLILSRFFPSRELLWSLPLLMVIALGQLVYLERTQRRLQVVTQEAELSLVESLQLLTELGQRYPLALFLATSTFLLVIIYISSEFLWFNIYGQKFDESALTGFLGLMRMVISLVQVALLYGVTRPLLKWVGVAKLNTVYPLTTLASLGGLLVNMQLPAAIGLHLNGDAFYKSINLPIHQLNYNAIPPQYVGRIRALSDGLIYSVGLTLAGGLLWVAHLYLILEQICWLAIALTVVLFIVRLPMGRFYAQSLEEMIRSDTINLDDFADAKALLPPQSHHVIREFLTESDLYTQIKGLDLATNISHPEQFFPEVLALLPSAAPELRQSVLKLYAAGDSEALESLKTWLTAAEPQIRAAALEVLIVNQYPLSAEQKSLLVADPDPEVKALALMALFQANDSSELDLAVAEQFWQLQLTDNITSAIARVIRYSQNAEFITLIEYLLPQAATSTRVEALDALVNLATVEDQHLTKIAITEAQHSDPKVRVAAYKLLGITQCSEALAQTTLGLADDNAQVRNQVALTLIDYGLAGLEQAELALSSPHPEMVQAAIAAIAGQRSKQANEILFRHLTPEFKLLNRTRKWQQQFPHYNPSWQLFGVAIEDYQQRLLQKVLYILSCLGYSRTASLVQRILATSDRRDLANAVEVLASINHRRFVQPLMPLLEARVADVDSSPVSLTPQWLEKKGYKILSEALNSSDRWLKTGASVALAAIPSTLLQDPDPIIQAIAQEIFPDARQLSCPISTTMNRLLLLRNVALFKNLSLDELFSIDQALEQKQILTGATVYTEGSWGGHLYIIASGRIQIVKQLDGEQQEIKQLGMGQYFGEIALFDEAPRWDGAIALEDSMLLCLEKKRFISLISQRPQIILEICRFLSMRLRETDKYMSAKK